MHTWTINWHRLNYFDIFFLKIWYSKIINRFSNLIKWSSNLLTLKWLIYFVRLFQYSQTVRNGYNVFAHVFLEEQRTCAVAVLPIIWICRTTDVVNAECTILEIIKRIILMLLMHLYVSTCDVIFVLPSSKYSTKSFSTARHFSSNSWLPIAKTSSLYDSCSTRMSSLNNLCWLLCWKHVCWSWI